MELPDKLITEIVDRVIEMLEDGDYLYYPAMYELKKDQSTKKFMSKSDVEN